MSDFFLDSDGKKFDLYTKGNVFNVLLNEPSVTPVRHHEYGLGWKCKNIRCTYFLTEPPILQQEILAVEQKAKLRKQKQKHKGQKHDNKE